MSKNYGFHQGDRSEYLGRYLLSSLGHTVMVERPADYFGVDMYLKLTDLSDGRGPVLQLNGMECAIQFKSDYQAIPIDTDDAKTALYDLRQPFFICVVDKQAKTIKLFPTLGRFHSYWSDRTKNVGIILKKHSDGSPFSKAPPDDLLLSSPSSDLKKRLEALEGYIYCGDPILTVGLEKMFGEENIDSILRSNLDELIESIKLDNQAIILKALGIPASADFEVDNNHPEVRTPGLRMENPTAAQLGLLMNCMSALCRMSADCFDLRPNEADLREKMNDMEEVRDSMRAFATQIQEERKRLFPDVKTSLFNFYLPGESAMLASQRLGQKSSTDVVRDQESTD